MTNTFDRLGRGATTICSGMTTTFAFNDANELLSETFSGGTLNGLAVTNAYDAYLRRTGVGLNTQPATLTQFGYDNASRLAGVTNGFYSAAYGYLANSPLVSTVTFRTNTTTRMTTTKTYDYLNRLTSIRSINSQPSTINSHDYQYNQANQRTRATLSDGSYWLYDYDSLGQVRSGKKYWYDGTPVAGQQFEYGFDDIGNRKNTKVGGDENGANLRPANYTNNSLNQITGRDVPGYLDIMGVSFATNSVTVNSQAAYRKGEYFRKELAVGNGSAPLWTNVIVAATGQTSVTGNVFVAKTAETFGYDADGNMTNDGRWALTWDSENRLTKAESLSSAPTASKRKVVWEFDCRGRRIRQTTSDGSSGSYVVTEDLKFIADGWRHIAELNATNNALVRSYAWGLDLSGSLDGAGGVGGLLMLNSIANGAHLYAYDGNGNVAALVKGSDGTVSANYEYDPFGQVLRGTGGMANKNRFQFSTKRNDRTTDFVLYEVRPYSSSPGKFLSRDPAEEQAGNNLYAFVANDAVNHADFLGMVIICCDAEGYFSELGLEKGKHYIERTKNDYAAKPGASFDHEGSLEKLIVWRMLLTRHAFKAKERKTEELKNHVRARKIIVQNALKANFLFKADQKLTADELQEMRRDPVAFFNRINDGTKGLGCAAVTMIIFETGNRNLRPNYRLTDGIWIPGDWGYIINKSADDFPGDWPLTLAGENVIHTGVDARGELFWGHFDNGVHPADSERNWFDRIRRWTSNGRHGDPVWKKGQAGVTGPNTGLDLEGR